MSTHEWRGAGKASLDRARAELDARTRAPRAQPGRIGADLESAAVLLDEQVSLRRALTDPGASGRDKAQLIEALLRGRVGSDALSVLVGMVRGRWSGPRDLADAIAELADTADLVAAERDGAPDRVEDELFDLVDIIRRQPALRQVLDDRFIAGAAKESLVRELLGHRVHPVTEVLVLRSVARPRGLPVEVRLGDCGRLAARRRDRLAAVVSCAVPLDGESRRRLENALRGIYGRPVRVHAAVDPSVIAGLRIRVGDEVIDGTLAARVAGARHRLSA